jgi:hypothetical protein
MLVTHTTPKVSHARDLETKLALLKEMKEAGVRLETWGDLPHEDLDERLVFLTTTDPNVAQRFGILEEWDDEDDEKEAA